MPAWAKLAWMNRETLLAAARKLKWPISTWVTIGVFAALGGALYWAFTTGHLLSPYAWPRIQWALLVVNVVGFAILYLAMRVWYGRQDELLDDVEHLRSAVDDLRVAVHEHEHEIEFTDGGLPDDDEHPETVNALPVARPPVPPSERATTEFSAVRAAPVSEREPATVQRVLGGRTFTFRNDEESAARG